MDGPRSEHTRIRVLIVDDHAIVRRGLRGLLDLVEDLVVVGEAADCEAAVRLAALCDPDVVLMDIVMPVKDGVAATAEIKVTMTAGAARMLLERNAPGVDAKLEELSSLARDALAEMRSLIFELRPGSLAEEGFLPALRRHVAAVGGRTGLRIRVEADPALPRLPLETEDALYRIAQEAVHNAVKHARAHEVSIEIAASAACVEMRIGDDGIGFEPGSSTEGLGLAGMAARAERCGGTAEVTSRPGSGTRLSVRLPLGEPEASAEP